MKRIITIEIEEKEGVKMEEIKAYRKSQGWTQVDMANYLEIPPITYIQWEQGKRNPPAYVLNLIKYKLKKDTEQITLETHPKDKEKRTIFIIRDKKDNFHSEKIAKNEYEVKKKREQLYDIWGKHYNEYVTEKIFIEM